MNANLNAFIVRRNQVLFFRVFPVLCILILLSIWNNELHSKLHSAVKFNMVHVIRYLHSEPDNYLVEVTTAELRELAKLENRDEFLDELLTQVRFVEVDLSLRLISHFDNDTDYLIQVDLQKINPTLAQNGSSAVVPPELKQEEEEVIKTEYLNRVLSDLISYNRSLKDYRDPECRKINYTISELPTFSLIVIFLNEPFSLFIRLIHSVFQRTPETLLKEVVLVDDFSDHPDLHAKLERYLATRFPLEKVRLIRLSKRAGLVRARMIGAHVAVGEVLVFLDAHCEVTDYWVEPLLHRIKEKRTAVVNPVVDEIDRNNFEYYYNRDYSLGAFAWDMYFTWISPLPEELEARERNYTAPVKTPTTIGGLFAIDRKYFWEIGSYDPGMLIWGGENLEMSFRIWQCGGSLEIVPCSRVGHVFRATKPYTVPAGMPNNTHALNSARLVEVWLDEFKELYYLVNAPKLETFEKKWTNISARKAFRKRMNCKSFKWYLDNVYPSMFANKLGSKHYGQFRNQAFNQCLDIYGHDESEFPLQVYPCHPKLFTSQNFFISNRDELRWGSKCATVWSNNTVGMTECRNKAKSDLWKYQNEQIYSSLAQKCIALKRDLNENQSFINALEACTNETHQKWKLKTYE